MRCESGVTFCIRHASLCYRNKGSSAQGNCSAKSLIRLCVLEACQAPGALPYIDIIHMGDIRVRGTWEWREHGGGGHWGGGGEQGPSGPGFLHRTTSRCLPSRIFAQSQTKKILVRVPPKCIETHLSDRPIVVRSPFRAKHHVAVQYMAGYMKCPLPPPLPQPPLPLSDPPSPAGPPCGGTRRTRKN